VGDLGAASAPKINNGVRPDLLVDLDRRTGAKINKRVSR
jgi:hypothetical protein